MNFGKLSVFFALVFLNIAMVSCQKHEADSPQTQFTSPAPRLGDKAVAQVDGTPIFASDVTAQAAASGTILHGETLSVDDPVFRATLNELIDQRVLALEALRQSLDQRDGTKRRLAAVRERILANVLIEDLIAQNVTDESLQRLFDEQAALRSQSQQVRAKIIKLKTQDAAKAIAERLAAGEDFGALAKEYSLDHSTGDIGGDMGYFSENAVNPEIAELAFSLDIDTVSAPTKIASEWVVMTVVARRPTPQPTFEDIRDEIESFMTYDVTAKHLKTLRARSDITLKLNEIPSQGKANTNTDKTNETE